MWSWLTLQFLFQYQPLAAVSSSPLISCWALRKDSRPQPTYHTACLLLPVSFLHPNQIFLLWEVHSSVAHALCEVLVEIDFVALGIFLSLPCPQWSVSLWAVILLMAWLFSPPASCLLPRSPMSPTPLQSFSQKWSMALTVDILCWCNSNWTWTHPWNWTGTCPWTHLLPQWY